MENMFIATVKDAVKNWWVSLVLGILLIAVGILILCMPAESYVTMSIMFSVFLFVAGIMEIVFAASNRKILTGWGWYLASGILDLLIGIALISIPALPMVMIPMLVIFWLMYKGFSAIGFSIDLSHYKVKGWGWLLTFGILLTLLSIAMLFEPVTAAITVVYLASFAFMLAGIFRVVLGFKLKSLHGNYKKAMDRIDEIRETVNNR